MKTENHRTDPLMGQLSINYWSEKHAWWLFQSPEDGFLLKRTAACVISALRNPDSKQNMMITRGSSLLFAFHWERQAVNRKHRFATSQAAGESARERREC